MTITTQSIKAVATGNGANTVFGYSFPIPSLDDLIVTIVTIASGNETVLSPSSFTTIGIGSGSGGNVTYPLSGPPLSNLYQIVIERRVAPVQETDLTNQGGAYPADIEDALDYLTMITQQLQDQINRSIVFSVADTVETTLPSAHSRAGKFLGFNSNGDPTAVDGLANGTTVSTAMIPVVTAPTTADALTALGLPGTLLDLLIPSGVEWPYHAGGTAPTGFVYPIGQPCTNIYPNYRAKLIAAGSPYGTNGVDPLMPDRRGTVYACKSNMNNGDNGLLTGGNILGAVIGTQTFQIIPGGIPDITSVNLAPINLDVNSTVSNVLRAVTHDNFAGTAGDNGPMRNITGSGIESTGTLGIGVVSVTSNNTSGSGLGAAISRVQPTFICNVLLKVH